MRELANIVFARFWGVVAIVVVFTAGTLVVCFNMPRSYSSSVTLLAKEPRTAESVHRTVPSDRSLEVFIKTQSELIDSDTVLARSLLLFKTRTALAEDARVRTHADAHHDYTRYEDLLTHWQAAGQAWDNNNTESNWDAFIASLDAMDRAIEQIRSDGRAGSRFIDDVARLRDRVDLITPDSDRPAMTEVFTIEVTQPGEPIQAKWAADLLAANYIDMYHQVQDAAARKATNAIRQTLSTQETERLATAEAAIKSFIDTQLASAADIGMLEQLDNNGSELGSASTIRRLQEENAGLSGQIAAGQQLREQLLRQIPEQAWSEGKHHYELDGRLALPDAGRLDDGQGCKGCMASRLALPDAGRLDETVLDDRTLVENFVTIIPEETLNNNVVIKQLKSKEGDLLIDYNRMIIEYQPEYRGLRDLKSELAGTRRQILREMLGEAESIDVRIATILARHEKNQNQIDHELEHLAGMNSKLAEYRELKSDLAQARAEYSETERQLAEQLRSRDAASNSLTLNIIDPAKTPDPRRPASPRTGLFVGIAFLLGLIFSTIYALIADYFDHTLNSVEDTERYLGVPVIGSIGVHEGGLLT